MERPSYDLEDPTSSLPASPPDPSDEAYSGLSFTPRHYAMASFDNLVALANHQERLEQARKVIWRDRGEPVAELGDVWECARHALNGGLRGTALGFGLRAGFNVFLLLFRWKKLPKNARIFIVQRAIFSVESLMSGAMMGTFVALYKFILNSLPLFTPTSYSIPTFLGPSRPATPQKNTGKDSVAKQNLTLSTEARLTYVRKQTRRWHAALAGFVAGSLAILWETEGRRVALTQQLFVRGLQGSFNAYSDKKGIRIPHGDVLLFSLCCGQIIYAFCMRPDTLDPAYDRWILAAARSNDYCIKIDRDLTRTGKFDMKQMEFVRDWHRTTPANRAILSSRIESALTTGDYGPRHGLCAVYHPWLDSCWHGPLDKLLDVALWMLPVYGALNFIPMLLFKRGKVLKRPLTMLMRALWGTARSASFLGMFVVIFQSWLCVKQNTYDRFTSPSPPFPLPKWLISFLISRPSYWFGGMLTGLSLFVEQKRRREELAMYVLPKALESAWVTARGKGWVRHTGKVGESLLCAISMAMIMSTYQCDPQHLSGLVRRVIYQFVGPN